MLHDIGVILDKPSPLDERECQIINTHSFETLQILRGIKGFEEMEVWVGYHQEEPSGGGYPFHVLGKNLPLEFSQV